MQPFTNSPPARLLTHTFAPYPPLNLADLQLHRVIQYADKREISSMIDDALKAGARLNHPNHYDSNALVIAVRANNYEAISPLLARGALLPAAPSQGVDLLMEACGAGHLDMAIKLIEVAKMSIHIQDSCGKTALHHALIGGWEDIVMLLLGSGANPNAEAHHLSQDEAYRILGFNSPLSDTSVTPLMIAVGKGDERLTNLLLDARANPDLGALSPVIIAAQRDHQSIFDRLLDKDADLTKCRDLADNHGLCACIASKVPVRYLVPLVLQHDFSADDGSIDSPLGLTVTAHWQDACALLLASGAPVERHDETDEVISIWDAALSDGRFSSPVAKLLTAARPADIELHHPAAMVEPLVFVAKNINNPALLSSKGFFTSLLLTASEKLSQLSAQASQLAPRQLALQAAVIIREALPELPAVGQSDVSDDVPAYMLWKREAEEKLRKQRDAWSAACATFIGFCTDKLEQATTLDFFLACAGDCPEETRLREFIAARTSEQSGMPDQVAGMVAKAWAKAAKWTVDWQISPDSAEEGNRFLLSLMRNLLTKASDEQELANDAPSLPWRSALEHAIPLKSLPLHQFCSDPVAWLRKFEARHSLADPDPQLPHDLQLELGLPVATCEQIAKVWRESIEAARHAPWKTPAELQRVLSRQLWLKLDRVFPGEDSREIVSSIGILLLQSWRSRVSETSLAEASLAKARPRKRSAEAEATGTPVAKKARTAPPDSNDPGQPDD